MRSATVVNSRSAQRYEARRPSAHFGVVLQACLLSVSPRPEELAVLAPLVGDKTDDGESDDRHASEDAKADRLQRK